MEPNLLDPTNLPELRLNDDTEIHLPDDYNETDAWHREIEQWMFPSLPRLQWIHGSHRHSADEQVDERLATHAVKGSADNLNEDGFWPQILIQHLMDENAVRDIVASLLNRGALPKDVSESRWINRVLGTRGHSPGYRKVLAILVLIRKTSYLKWFFDKKFDDERLRQQHGLVLQCLLDENPDSKHRGKREALNEQKAFNSYRLGMFPPFISKSKQVGKVSRYVFEARSIWPWKLLKHSSIHSTSTNISSLYGGYGDVQKIVIHDWQHDFHGDLDRVGAEPGCFALKRLYARNEKKFDEEVKQLERFGGRHAHIVTLLSAITLNSGNPTYQLLFPLAHCDLLDYWKQKPQPTNHVALKWVVEQLFGMADALSFIHNPGLKDGNKTIYGRHGDIKPENVLFFQGKDQGTLVLSDLGLTMTHGEQSRSNRPGETIPASPNYRPPECDIEGEKGYVSRAFDIWTLGCLFLEFLVWTFDGWGGYLKFEERRYSRYINGFVTSVYFEILRIGEKDFAFKVKDVIHEEFSRLHQHPICSEFHHKMLDLVENHMLLVRSNEADRITATKLRNELLDIKNNCKIESYCVTPCPRPSFNQPRLPVRAQINKMTEQYISRNYISFKDHRGATSSFGKIQT